MSEQEKFKYSPELLMEIWNTNWGPKRDSNRIFNLALKNDPALFIAMSKSFGNLEKGKYDNESLEEFQKRRQRYIKGNRIYGKVLSELEAWDKLHPLPKQPTAPNKYFDDEASK
jgi:hypothetical protein